MNTVEPYAEYSVSIHYERELLIRHNLNDFDVVDRHSEVIAARE